MRDEEEHVVAAEDDALDSEEITGDQRRCEAAGLAPAGPPLLRSPEAEVICGEVDLDTVSPGSRARNLHEHVDREVVLVEALIVRTTRTSTEPAASSESDRSRSRPAGYWMSENVSQV
jgi:hypothetical protein